MAKRSTEVEGGTNKNELIAKLALLAKEDRATYRIVRALMWRFVVDNSSRSDFPSNYS